MVLRPDPLPPAASPARLREVQRADPTTAADPAVRRDLAKAALMGLLAGGGDHANPDLPAARAVRYADALLQALNRTHEEARHATGHR